MERPRILILGKLPPPLMGPAIATKIILDSDLNGDFELSHFDTRINSNVADLGTFKWGKIKTIKALYYGFSERLKRDAPELVLIPIGQTTAGFLKDIPFIRMAFKSGARVVIQLRGSEFRTWYDRLDPILKNMVRNALRKVDGVIVLGDGLKGIFEGLVPDDKIFVVPNGADYSFPPRRSGGLRILYLANYLPGKGIKETLEAMVMLVEKYGRSFEFQGYGSWNNETYKKECLDLVRDYPNIRLNGSISGEAKWQAFADADIFVFAPNAPEGHPWSLVEASAAGLPLVSSDRGVIGQNVIDGVNGFLLENPHPAEMAEKISILVEDADLRRKLGKESRKLYEEKFTASAMSGNMRGVFQSILQKKCVE